MTKAAVKIDNNLAALRRKRGFSAAHLAQLVNISRQTVYAIEAGSYVPNTALALRLARALDARVEEIFALPETPAAPAFRSERVTVLPGGATPQAGQPVQLCRVDKRIMASAPAAIPWYFSPSDGVVTAPPAR